MSDVGLSLKDFGIFCPNTKKKKLDFYCLSFLYFLYHVFRFLSNIMLIKRFMIGQLVLLLNLQCVGCSLFSINNIGSHH